MSDVEHLIGHRDKLIAVKAAFLHREMHLAAGTINRDIEAVDALIEMAIKKRLCTSEGQD